MVVVIYEMNFVRDVFDRVIFMDKGYILEEGVLEEIFIYLISDRCKEFLDKVINNK